MRRRPRTYEPFSIQQSFGQRDIHIFFFEFREFIGTLHTKKYFLLRFFFAAFKHMYCERYYYGFDSTEDQLTETNNQKLGIREIVLGEVSKRTTD